MCNLCMVKHLKHDTRCPVCRQPLTPVSSEHQLLYWKCVLDDWKAHFFASVTHKLAEASSEVEHDLIIRSSMTEFASWFELVRVELLQLSNQSIQ